MFDNENGNIHMCMRHISQRVGSKCLEVQCQDLNDVNGIFSVYGIIFSQYKILYSRLKKYIWSINSHFRKKTIGVHHNRQDSRHLKLLRIKESSSWQSMIMSC